METGTSSLKIINPLVVSSLRLNPHLEQVYTCRKHGALPKTICTKNVYQKRVNFTRMDQSERFVSLGFPPGKVYPTGVNFTTGNSRNRALTSAALAQNNYRTANYPHRPIIAYGEKKSQQITRTGG